MPIYKGENPKTLFKGDYRPAELYRGSQKLTGYEVQTVSGQEITAEDTYNDTAELTVRGNAAQDGVPAPDNPIPIVPSEGKLWSEGRSEWNREPSSIVLPVLRAIPDGQGGYAARDELVSIPGKPGQYDLRREVIEKQITRLSKNDASAGSYLYYTHIDDGAAGEKRCSHFRYNRGKVSGEYRKHGMFTDMDFKYGTILYFWMEGVVSKNNSEMPNADRANAWLQAQADAGTPLTVWYPAAEPTAGRINLGELKTYPYYTHIDTDCAVKPDIEATVKIIGGTS